MSSLEVDDRFCPWNEGRYALEAAAGGATVRATDASGPRSRAREPLGAAYLGGATFRQLHRAGRVPSSSPGALARADALFALGSGALVPVRLLV